MDFIFTDWNIVFGLINLFLVGKSWHAVYLNGVGLVGVFRPFIIEMK